MEERLPTKISPLNLLPGFQSNSNSLPHTVSHPPFPLLHIARTFPYFEPNSFYLSKNLPVRLQTLCCLLLYVGIMACSPSKHEEALAALERVPLSYAKGFGIWQGEGYKVVEVSQAFPGKHEPFRYLVLEEGQPDYDPKDYDAVVTLPLNSIVLTSTTQVPHLDLLGISGLMTGFPNTDLISSAAMRRHIESGAVKDLGKGVLPNIETLIALDPDLMVVSTMGDNLQLVS